MAVFVAIVVLDAMKLDWIQRITLGGAIVLFSYFIGHTIEKKRGDATPPPLASAPSALSTPPNLDASKRELKGRPNASQNLPTPKEEAPEPPLPQKQEASPAVPPLRRPIKVQAEMLRNWIGQTAAQTKVNEMWLSQIFQRTLDNRPDGPDVDVPAALRYLNSKDEVEILETTRRRYRTWWGEVFQEDIRFNIKNPNSSPSPQGPTSTTINNAPGGFAISGGSVINPSVTNIVAPTGRVLSKEKADSLVEQLKGNKKVSVAIVDFEPVTHEMDQLTRQLQGIFREANWDEVAVYKKDIRNTHITNSYGPNNTVTNEPDGLHCIGDSAESRMVIDLLSAVGLPCILSAPNLYPIPVPAPILTIFIGRDLSQ